MNQRNIAKFYVHNAKRLRFS